MTSIAASPAGRSATLECGHLDTVAKFFRALGDPTRLGLLAFILDAERTVAECVAHAGISQPRVSVHLSCLVDCGYVTARRDGRKYYYSVTDPRVADLVVAAHALAASNTAALAACPIIDAGTGGGERS